MRIEGNMNESQEELEVKRFYLPNIKVIDNCPKCNKEIVFDGNMNYISYPKLNSPESVHFYCEDCDEEWEKNIKLTVNVEVCESEE